MSMPVQITDASLRDGVEDFVLKHIRLEELNRLGKLLDRVGFYSLDCWGGGTFYAALTQLQEDPWERLRKLRRAVKHTPLQMIVRGQMLVGSRPYHKEVVRKFMARAANLGIDIFRIYDQLNDLDNMKMAVALGKELRKEVEATILFSINPAVKIDDYVQQAGALLDQGADAICINDSLGVMTTPQIASLLRNYRRNYHHPLRLHLHDNHGNALAAYLVGIRAGVERVDTTLSPLTWPYGPPAVESLLFSLGGTLYDPHLDVDALSEVAEHLKLLQEAYKYRPPDFPQTEAVVTANYLPPLLKEFIREELVRRDARDRQQAAFKEAHKVWADLGFLPLKGRILEIVGQQTVANVLAGGRYLDITAGLANLLKGRYGPFDSLASDELRQVALKARGEEREQTWEGRLRQAPGITQEEDILTYTLFPEEAQRFFERRTQAPPAPSAPKTLPVDPQAPAPPPLRIAPTMPRGLSLTHRGEEVPARLEGLGPFRGNKQTLFINVGDNTEEIEVALVPGGGALPEYRITFHGETYAVKFRKAFPKEEEYTPIFLEINQQIEEFLIKHLRGD